jgi:hypothetical protein
MSVKVFAMVCLLADPTLHTPDHCSLKESSHTFPTFSQCYRRLPFELRAIGEIAADEWSKVFAALPHTPPVEVKVWCNLPGDPFYTPTT